MGNKKYIVHTIDEKTYAIEEKTAIMQAYCYLLLGEEKALLIDTCTGRKDLPETVSKLTSLPIIVANTHAHVDHIGGNHFYHELWFHEADKEVFHLHTNPKYTYHILTEGMPKLLFPILRAMTKDVLNVDASGTYQYFDNDKIFHLGDRDIEVIPTPGHTPGSVCFLDRASRQLFSGDTICEWGILLHFEQESCPPQVYLESVERLIGLEDTFDTIWPGHHGMPVDKSYLEDYRMCAKQIVDKTAQYEMEKGKRCARYHRVIISVKDSE